MSASSEVFNYLSVLISIVIGLGMSQILAGVVRVLHHRHTTKVYLPTMVWAANLMLLLALYWWADFSLMHHQHWTFAMFLVTLTIPAALYINSSLILPGNERAAGEPMRTAYRDNRRPFFALQSLIIALSFLQTYLLDSAIRADADTALKIGIFAVTLIPIIFAGEALQTIVACTNLVWLLLYVSLLFANVRA